MKRSVVWLGLLVAAQIGRAYGIEGVVRNSQGEAIKDAVIASKIRVQSDEFGHFALPDLALNQQELQIKASGYDHRVFSKDSEASLQVVSAPAVIEMVTVVGLPWRTSDIESAQPVNVLGDEALRRRQASTLGETLKYQVGVHSNYYGPVASSPIIRGLEGPRVLITQNGLDAGDASRVGPDHAVASEAATARQIEILRGPATLFYGSGAIGGVVNIVDDRVPQSSNTEGEWRIEHNSVADDKLLSGSITTGANDFALHTDGFWRESSDYKIPVEDGSESKERLSSSAYDAQGVNLGGSYLFDAGFVGLAIGRLERTYGIPGHSHGEGDDVPVHAELEQDRIQLISELDLERRFINGIHTRFGYTDYSHDEIEITEVATTFANRSYEARLDIFHQPVADWRGVATLHYKRSDFSAQGAEAFTPPSITESWAVALLEERRVGEWLLQVGGRAEQVTITADNFIADLSEGQQGQILSVYAVDYQAGPISLSVGGVWDFSPGYNFAVSYSHSQRAPAAAELLSFGPHIGSGLFEVGALINVNQQNSSDFHFALQRDHIHLETSNNIDIALRKYDGDIGFIGNIFYNSVGNYYFLARTNAVQQISELHEDHYHYFSMPVYGYQAKDIHLYGFESEFVWQASSPLKLSLISDYIRAQVRDGDDLPRIPPLRVGAAIDYQVAGFALELNATHYFKQDKVAALETKTEGYILLDVQLSHALGNSLPGVTFYLKGQNLANEYARVHSSFLKDKAPLPARSIAVGISGKF